VNSAANFSNTLSDEERFALIKKGDPRFTDEQAHDYLEALRSRFEQKQAFIERGFSNKLAEHALDRQGWPRPWGWHTVFFYPDSNLMRTQYLVILVATVGFLVWQAI
jgi:hypothetical protein